MAGFRSAFAAVPFVALVLSVGGAVAAPAPKVKNTKGSIEAIAMDGPRVAYDVGAGTSNSCNKLFVWNVLTGGGALVSAKGTCEADSTSTGAGVPEIAVAGTRVAWIVNLGGNTESDDYLYTASLPKPRERKLSEARRTGDVDGVLEGDWIGGLVGDGDVLAANRWSTDDKGAVTKGVLQRIGAAGLRAISAGTATIVAQSADLGRIAVLRPDGTVAIYSAAGKLMRTTAPGSAREVALRKDYLVVLTRTKTIEIYNANTGAHVRTWPVPGGAAHLDVHSGIAVYSVWRRLHALRLTTGKDVVLASEKRAIVEAQIEAPGVVYAYNTVKGIRDVGNLAFLPMSRVIRAVS